MVPMPFLEISLQKIIRRGAAEESGENCCLWEK
jgi:hypothetical protein